MTRPFCHLLFFFKNMKNLHTLLFCLSYCFLIQTCSIMPKNEPIEIKIIVNDAVGNGLEDVRILLEKEGESQQEIAALTNDDGIFILKENKQAKVKLSFYKEGFVAQDTTIDLANATNSIRIGLKKE